MGFDIVELVATLRSTGSDSRSVEAKSAAGGLPNSLSTTICAFANMPGGGTLILGLDEANGFDVVNLRNRSVLAAGVVSVARKAVDPAVQVEVHDVPFEGRHLVVVEVAELPIVAKPCRVVGTRKAYLRFGDGDYELSSLEADAFIIGRTRPRFDEVTLADADRQDLDPDLVASFQANVRASGARLRMFGDEELLVRKGVLDRSGCPTVAGIAALGIYPQQFMPSFTIRAALLPTGESRGRARVLDEASFTGPIGVMLDDAVGWVRKNSRNEIIENRATGRVSDRIWPPTVAVRELIANALVHRDLSPWSSGRAIELRMSTEVFQINNPGGLYGVALASLGRVELTSARNRQLIDMCRFLRTQDGRAVEALATGIPTVFEELSAAGLEPPKFYDDGISFTAIISAKPLASSRSSTTTTHMRRLGPASAAVVAILQAGPADVHTIAADLGIHLPAAIKRLQRLTHAGLVVSDAVQGTRAIYRLPDR